jgi:hypothetical protein
MLGYEIKPLLLVRGLHGAEGSGHYTLEVDRTHIGNLFSQT